MASTDSPEAATAEQEEEREFEAPRTTPTSSSKRKPRMITAAEETTPPDNDNHNSRAAWPYPPPPPHEYHPRSARAGEHPGAMYSPAYYDRSMQPPPHHSHRNHRMEYPPSSSSQHHKQPKTPSRASQSIHRTSSSDDPAEDDNEDDDLEPESMETEEDMGTDYMNMQPISVGKEMGADYLNLPVGSFADDSPPRRKTPDKKRSPSVYPPPYGGYHHHYHAAYYTKSPRGSSYPPMYYPPPPGSHPLPASKGAARSAHAAHPASAPPAHHHPHHYPYPPYPPHRYYPPAYPHHHDQHWASPQAYDATPADHHEAFGEDNEEEQEHADADDDNNDEGKENSSDRKSNIKEAFRTSPSDAGSQHGFRTSPSSRSDGSPSRRPTPPTPMDGPTSTNTTPEKLKPRSPFRSPPLSQTKRSPFHGSPTPLGGYGSFGMLDTPGGTLAAEFSPMGPVLNNPFATGAFGEHPTPPQLSLSRSNSEDELGVEEAGEGLSLATSPFSGFIKGFTGGHLAPKNTGGLQGVSRSPLMSERRLAQTTASDPRSDRPTTQALTSTQPNNTRRPRDPATTKILASPMEPSSGAKPRKLWNGPGESSGPMRLELGTTSSLKKSFEGINSMMRAGAAAKAPPAAAPAPPPVPMATPTTAPRGAPPTYSQYPPPPHASYRRLNTPMKLEPSPVQTSKAPTGLATIGSKRANAVAAPLSAVKSTRDGKVPRTAGKENVTVTTPAQQPQQQKRSPCNCKKSRCLKLYCECFAGELFCEGCNCADCQNTPNHSQIRDKAIKDTRAKNPNAFKPRITVKAGQVAVGASPHSGHNMGCRCKRSECLKKYCECFQNSVMCGSKCKCLDCANFAGSQKLIDKRRKMKDARGAEQAMKAGFDSWKGAQNSGRKQHIARPAVHGMRPMPSPVGTPSGRLPMMPPHMMHPSPSGHPGPHPHYMRPMHHPFIGYSPMGMPPHHVSPNHFGMYAQHPQHRPPPPTPTNVASAQKKSPTNSAMKPPLSSSKKQTPPSQPQECSPTVILSPPAQAEKAPTDNEKSAETPIGSKTNEAADNEKSAETPSGSKEDETDKSDDEAVIKETHEDDTDKASPTAQPPSLFEKVLASARSSPTTVQPTPKDKPGRTVHPTPADTMTAVAAITPATPSPMVTRQSANNKACDKDVAFPYFGGDLPEFPQSVAQHVFSFLSETEKGTGATLVCKQWNELMATRKETN